VEKKLEQLFSSEGCLKKAFKDFEERSGQKEMAHQVMRAYSQDEIALIEAGTGIGKSVAYLLPAILWALHNKEKTVISTYTIALQEQLLYKDIPALLQLLKADLKVVLVKGMSNYVCLRKLDELHEEDRESSQLKSWAERTYEGSRSDISFSLSAPTWEKVSADAYACSHMQCPHYKNCFFFKARRKVQDAHLLIVNHHLLLVDLAARKRKDYKEDKAIIPFYRRIVIDEAHHLEEVALNSLSQRFDRHHLVRLLGRLYSDLAPERSRFFLIRQAITAPHSALVARLEIELPAEKRALVERCEKAFAALQQYMAAPESKFRLREEHFKTPLWATIKNLFSEFTFHLKRFIASVENLKKEIEEEFASHAVELQSILWRLEEQAEGLEVFFSPDQESQKVQWVEVSSLNSALVEAKLSISSYLQEEFFEPLATASLCSATLATGGNFDYFKSRLGISGKTVTENIYLSPFDYKAQALLAIPTDFPDPVDPLFSQRAFEIIARAVEISRGGAFILFTSYEMLKAAYQALQPFAEQRKMLLLKQGETSRQLLIEKFKAKSDAVLLGTDSFWEGVDVAGEALRLVVIVKLPFKVPTEPLTEALSECVEKTGKNAFLDYQVPQAVMKFKQGFGRLIRTKTDRGCVLCLDKRMITKAYGKHFLKSLPPCRTLFASTKEVLEGLAFLGETAS
jgi:ATP-dependent DNA helicase DinG